MKIYMKNRKTIRINREIATIIWERMELGKDKFIQLNDKNTKETLLVVNVDEISHIE